MLAGRRPGTAVIAARAAAGALLASGAAGSPGAAPSASPSASAAASSCRPWTARTLASGLGQLENLEPMSDGTLLISMAAQGRIGG